MKRQRNGLCPRMWQSVWLTVVAWTLDEKLVVLRNRPLDLLESQDLRRPVPVVDNCPHAFTPSRSGRVQLTVRTTFPVFCPVSTYFVASTTSSSG